MNINRETPNVSGFTRIYILVDDLSKSDFVMVVYVHDYLTLGHKPSVPLTKCLIHSNKMKYLPKTCNFTGEFIRQYYFMMLVPIGIVGNLLSFMVGFLCQFMVPRLLFPYYYNAGVYTCLVQNSLNSKKRVPPRYQRADLLHSKVRTLQNRQPTTAGLDFKMT